MQMMDGPSADFLGHAQGGSSLLENCCESCEITLSFTISSNSHSPRILFKSIDSFLNPGSIVTIDHSVDTCFLFPFLHYLYYARAGLVQDTGTQPPSRALTRDQPKGVPRRHTPSLPQVNRHPSLFSYLLQKSLFYLRS